MSLFVLFTYFYSIIQQRYTVMLHSQDCTGIVRPQRSGTVVMRHDIGRTVNTAYIFGFMGITEKLSPVNTQSKIKQRRVNDLSLISWIKNGFSAQRGRGITRQFFFMTFVPRWLQTGSRVLVEEIASWNSCWSHTCTALNPVKMCPRTNAVCAYAYGHNLCPHCIWEEDDGES